MQLGATWLAGWLVTAPAMVGITMMMMMMRGMRKRAMELGVLVEAGRLTVLRLGDRTNRAEFPASQLVTRSLQDTKWGRRRR